MKKEDIQEIIKEELMNILSEEGVGRKRMEWEKVKVTKRDRFEEIIMMIEGIDQVVNSLLNDMKSNVGKSMKDDFLAVAGGGLNWIEDRIAKVREHIALTRKQFKS